MGAPARLAAGLLAAALAACSQTPQPVKPAAEPEPAADAAATPPATPEDPAPEPAPPATPEAAPPEQPPAEPSAPRPSSTVIVIEPGGKDPGDVDVVAAAKAERERRATAPPASRTITNQNLVKAKPGEKPKAPAPAAKIEAAAAPATPDGSDEAYWRGRSRELRQRWKEAVDEIAGLESDADLLRRRFYAEADPYVRDGQIKPDWDRVLDRIREMREAAARRQAELVAHLEEGRRAGALPGWLREGIELEPPAAGPRPGERPHEAVEPPVYPEPRDATDDDGEGKDGDG